MVTDLKRTLKLAGIGQRNFAEELISVCRDQGWKAAVQLFYKQKERIQVESR